MSSRDGLPQNTVKAIAVDLGGYLWVGTQDGAAYYDGRVWTTVNMPTRNVSNWVVAICAASDGSILFGTNGAGICVLKNGRWSVLDPSNSALRDSAVDSIVEQRTEAGGSRLVIAAGSCVYWLEDGVWTAFDAAAGLPEGEIFNVVPSSDDRGGGALWAAAEAGVYRFERHAWSIQTQTDGLPSEIAYCVAEQIDNQGNRTTWAGTDEGLAVLAAGRWERVADPNGPGSSSVYCLLTTSDDAGAPTLWAGTDTGLYQYSTGVWRRYDVATGLPDHSVISLFELGSGSDEGGLLVGTLSGGLACLGKANWLRFDTHSGLPDNHVYSFLETDDDAGQPVYWIGTTAGLARLEAGKWTVFATGQGLPNARINCLVATGPPERRVIWAGTFGGLCRFENGRWTSLSTHDGFPSDAVRCLLAADGTGGGQTLWVGTHKGLVRLEGGKWTLYDESSGLPDNQVLALERTVSPSGVETIWAGTLGGGLARFENGTWSVANTASGLPNDLIRAVRALDAPDGARTLWVTTLGGAAWTDLDQPNPQWNVLSDQSSPALPNNVVYDVRQDRQGRIYLLSNKGVARLTRRAPTPDDPSLFELYNFTEADGLPGNECNGGASIVDRAGRIWVGTVAGAAVLAPKPARAGSAPAPLRFERTLVAGAADGQTDPSSTSPDDEPLVGPPGPTIDNAVLSHDENNIVFEYALLQFFKESETVYRTQLVGLDEHPSPWSSDFKRSFAPLPSGDYEFKVWARDFAGRTAGPISVRFRIAPAPWRTVWAYGLYAVALVGLLYGGHRVRVRSYERRNRMLEDKVLERTEALDRKNHELAEAVESLVLSERRAMDLADRAVKSERAANDANRAKSTFLANMSHELRTPLNGILGFVQLLERKKNRDPDDREYLSIIARSGEHLLALINDVLSISKIEAGKATLAPEPFDLADLVRNVGDLVSARADAKALVFSVDVEGALPESVFGDEGKLRQILLNLLSNAIKFTDVGSVTLRVAWRDGRARFDVADTGYGIAEDEAADLFEPFVQTESGRKSTEGTGLGLAITRDFVRLMGGEITVASALNVGTTFGFDIDLPETAERFARRKRTVTGLKLGSKTWRALVVDDRAENRRLLVDLLTPIGFSVREAENGLAAVDCFHAWRPHLILIDVRMPVMNGDEATRRIRALESPNDPRVVVIAVSASVFQHDRRAILDAGCDEFLSKPVRTDELLERIGALLGVQCRYGAETDTVDHTGPETTLAERLAELPVDLIERLGQELTIGAIDDAATTIDAIRQIDPTAGADLSAMLKNYQVDDLMDLLTKATGKTDL